MSAAATQPCTVIAAQRVRPERTYDFLRAQEKISEAMRRFPGLLGKELIRPAPDFRCRVRVSLVGAVAGD